MKIHSSVRFKITAISVSAILISIVAILLASYTSIHEENDRRSVETMGLIGKDTKNTLDEYFEGIEQSVDMAANMAVDDLDPVTLVQCGAAGSHAGPENRTPEQTARLDAYIAEHCDTILKTFESVANHTNGIVTYYYCVNPEVSAAVRGFCYSRVGKAGFDAREPLDAAAFDPEAAENTWYSTPIRRGRPTWVGPYSTKYPEEMWVCAYTVPVYSVGALIGVLGMEIPLDTLTAQVSPIQVYKTGFASLCDTEGRVLYHPTLPLWSVPELIDVSAPRKLLVDEDSGDTLIRYSNDKGEKQQMCFFTLRNGIKLVVTAPVREINASLLRLLRVIFTITGGVIVIFAVVLMLVIRRITSPLVRLTEASQQLADADYDVELSYRGKDEVGKLTLSFIRMRDQLRAYIEDLNRRINTDMLTGLPNMRYFFRLAVKARDRLLAEGREPVMLYFDLVGMKHYNRQYGFEEGDKLLRDVGAILAKRYGMDCVCRFSEDHFAALTDDKDLEDRLRDVFRACESANGGKALPVRVGIFANSTGTVGVNEACDRAKYVCDKYADTWVSGFYYFDRDMLTQLDGTRYIINRLDQALAEGWITVYYQPIIRAVNGCVCDEEALARWIDPERGMLPPDVFIPILETAHLIYKVDLYVLDRILEKMKTLSSRGRQVVPHSVNLSRADFDSCDIVEEIRRRVDGAGIARDRLTIEITESVIGSDFDFIKKQIDRFQALGFPVWMDDFGSGYSSLNVLQDIHFDLIKFDMRFMKRFNENKECRIILSDQIRMAIDLGVDTVCEGVETAAEAEFLREIGCSKLQGYHFCKPIPLEEILRHWETGLTFGFENPAESEYYAAVGKVNLSSVPVIAEGENANRDYFDTLPAGIMEVFPEQISYIRTNPAYRSFLHRHFGFDLTARPNGYSVNPDGQPVMFLQMLRKCCRDGVGTLYDGKLADGSTVHGVINPVGKNPSTGATAVSIAILSVTDAAQTATYDDIATALAADYYSIYVVNLDTDEYIEYSSNASAEELAVERSGSDFFASARRDTMTRLYEEDCKPFLAAFTKEGILRELDAQGVFSVTYRLIDTGAPVYANMKITRMPGGNRIIIGISCVDSQMKQKERQEELQKERDAMVRVMALSDGFLIMYTVDPVTGRYIEYSSSDDYDTLGMAKEGCDFFGQSVINAEKFFWPEDIAAFRKRFTRENVMRDIQEHGAFRIQYRLMIGGEPKPVTLKAALFRDGEEEKLVVGVRAWRKRINETGDFVFSDEPF